MDAGPTAQSEERRTRIAEVVGSNPIRSTRCTTAMQPKAPMANDYRNTMLHYLGEALQMIERSLSGGDFEKPLRQIFGTPSDDEAEMALRTELGLLLRKAQLHIVAALRANKSNNLHSMAIHIRVVLECAAQVVMKANAAVKGPRELKRMLNVTESDVQYALLAMSRGRIGRDEIQRGIIDARRGIGQHWEEPPKRVTVTDKISSLPGGRGWYDHLSKFFCHSKADVLSGPLHCGGVVSGSAAEVDSTFALFLEHLTHRVLLMLLGQGLLLSAVGGGTRAYDDALDLMERTTAAAQSVRPAGWPHHEHTWPGIKHEG